MSAEARLRFYASVFDVVEVNSSYYAIPDVLTVRRWAERTPPGFVFHVKAWADEAFRLFRAAALSPLADAGKLGYILFQLAPWA
jgi:uncharacterized protein YecE (DUF72 family)